MERREIKRLNPKTGKLELVGYAYNITLGDKSLTIKTWKRKEKQGGGETIDHHSCMEIAEALGFEQTEDSLLISPSKNNDMLVAFRMVWHDPATGRKVVEVHEASANSTTGVSGKYTVRMAWKRTQDACILRLAKLYLAETDLPEILYSDIQFDDYGADAGGSDRASEIAEEFGGIVVGDDAPKEIQAIANIKFPFKEYRGRSLLEVYAEAPGWIKWVVEKVKVGDPDDQYYKSNLRLKKAAKWILDNEDLVKEYLASAQDSTPPDDDDLLF